MPIWLALGLCAIGLWLGLDLLQGWWRERRG